MTVIATTVFSQEQDRHWLSIETDPVSTIFGARTISVIIQPTRAQYWSVFTNVVTADFPNWMDDFLNPKNKGKGFDASIIIGGGVGIDYTWREDGAGWYVGVIHLVFQNEVEKKEIRKNLLTGNIIPRVGYRWYFGKDASFYLNPFMGIRYEYLFSTTSRQIGDRTYSAAGLQPFGTIHIGYHF